MPHHIPSLRGGVADAAIQFHSLTTGAPRQPGEKQDLGIATSATPPRNDVRATVPRRCEQVCRQAYLAPAAADLLRAPFPMSLRARRPGGSTPARESGRVADETTCTLPASDTGVAHGPCSDSLAGVLPFLCGQTAVCFTGWQRRSENSIRPSTSHLNSEPATAGWQICKPRRTTSMLCNFIANSLVRVRPMRQSLHGAGIDLVSKVTGRRRSPAAGESSLCQDEGSSSAPACSTLHVSRSLRARSRPQ